MTAQKWLETCLDESLGFIYIDCYAHTGQDNGEILELAWPKLQNGGVFAGDDYDRKQWPKTYRAVNDFAAKFDREICVRRDFCGSTAAGMGQYPTWWFRK